MIKSQKISSAIFYLIVLGVLSTLLGILREMALAYKFGASGITDSFLVAIIPISLLVYFAKGWGVAFVSQFSKDLVKDEEKAWFLGSRVMNTTLILSLVAGLFFFLFAPFFVRLVAPGFNAEKLNLTITLSRITVPVFLVIPLFIFIKSFLNSYKHFTWPEIASLFPNLGIILGILILSLWWGIKGAVLGLVAGYILQFLIPSIKILPWFFKNYSLTISLKDSQVRKFFLYSFFLLLILAGLNIDIIADRVFASYLESGSIAALNFARRISTSTYYLIAYAFATTLLPVFSTKVAQKDWIGFKKLFQKSIKIMAFILLPISLLIFVLRDPILILLFKHGAFGNRDLLMTSSVLAIYSLSIFAFAGIVFLARVFYALDDIKIPALLGVLVMVLNIIFDFIFVQFLSFQGLALATFLAANLNFIILMVYLQYKFRLFKITDLYKFLLKISIALLFMLATTFTINFCLKDILLRDELVNNLFRLFIIGGSGTLVFLVVSYLVRIPELFELRKFLTELIYKQGHKNA